MKFDDAYCGEILGLEQFRLQSVLCLLADSLLYNASHRLTTRNEYREMEAYASAPFSIQTDTKAGSFPAVRHIPTKGTM